jgi:putative protein-disulfide isomerase
MMGGLRPGTTKPLDEAGRRTIREHWEHVQAASGQPFDFRFFERERFVYDTEPASRAVIVVRRSGAADPLVYLHRVQAAFYVENRDVTDEQVLADLAPQSGIERDDFLQAFRSEDAKQETSGCGLPMAHAVAWAWGLNTALCCIRAPTIA